MSNAIIPLACAAWGSANSLTDGPPEALRRLERATNEIRTARIAWSTELFGVQRQHETCVAGPARTETVVTPQFYENGGEIVEAPNTTHIFRSPELDLQREGTSAERLRPQSSGMGVSLLPQCLVRDSDGPGPRSVHEALFGSPDEPPREFSTEVVDGIHVVTARLDAGEEYRWWIDPEQGWWPTRMQRLQNGQVVEEQAVKLKCWGDTWFPEEIDFGYGVIHVTEASFNQPDHPRQLTPADIGVVAGTGVTEWPQPGHSRRMVWNGTKSIPRDEWERLEETGRVQDSPLLAEQRNRSARLGKLIRGARRLSPNEVEDGVVVRHVADVDFAVGSRKLASTQPSGRVVDRRTFESEWERYTREFIANYNLNEAQAERAMAILRECQARGSEYAERHKDQFDALEDRIRKAADPGGSQEQRASARKDTAAARQQLADLLHPIDEVFEKELKPRLDRLPTRKQRADAEKKNGGRK